MIDRTTKLLLATIAVGIWVHAIATTVHIARIADDLHLIATGVCRNKTICFDWPRY
jgi:hypothetical protein